MSRFAHWYMIIGSALLFLFVMEVALRLNGTRQLPNGPFIPVVAPIPHRVHFMWHSTPIPPSLQHNVDTWVQHNPHFTFKIWTNAAALEYVQTYFPTYLDTYMALSTIERTDLFRYLLLYREGGVYSDLDVVCARPLQQYLDLLHDGMVVGWEGDWESSTACQAAGSARTRLLAQWVLAASPNHPALERVLLHVATQHNKTFSHNSIRDTHERTGAVAWTDAVMWYVQQHQPGHAISTTRFQTPPVVFLPRAVWGVAEVEMGERSLAHQYMGSWKKRDDNMHPLPYGDCAVSEFPLAPVTALDWYPRFSILTQASGAGDQEVGEDVVKSVNLYGSWQAGMSPAARPGLQQMVVALLDDAAAQVGYKGWYVDIGAGYGLTSFAAASRGFNVLMFESALRSVAAIRGTIAYHDWQEQVLVLPQPLGNTTEELCLIRTYPGTNVEEQRGYSRPSQLPPATHLPPCHSGGRRQMTHAALAQATAPHVVRVNANGYEPAVVMGMLPMLMDMGDGVFTKARRPYALLLTWQPAWMEDAAEGSTASLVHTLTAAGYTRLALAFPVAPVDGKGYACKREEDLAAHLFGDDEDQWVSINWCFLKPSTLTESTRTWRMHDKPRHLIALHEDLRVGGVFHRMQGMGLEK